MQHSACAGIVSSEGAELQGRHYRRIKLTDGRVKNILPLFVAHCVWLDNIAN